MNKKGELKKVIKVGIKGTVYRLHRKGYNKNGLKRLPQKPPSPDQIAHRKAFAQAAHRRANSADPKFNPMKGKLAYKGRSMWLDTLLPHDNGRLYEKTAPIWLPSPSGEINMNKRTTDTTSTSTGAYRKKTKRS